MTVHFFATYSITAQRTVAWSYPWIIQVYKDFLCFSAFMVFRFVSERVLLVRVNFQHKNCRFFSCKLIPNILFVFQIIWHRCTLNAFCFSVPLIQSLSGFLFFTNENSISEMVPKIRLHFGHFPVETGMGHIGVPRLNCICNFYFNIANYFPVNLIASKHFCEAKWSGAEISDIFLDWWYFNNKYFGVC